MTSRVLAPLCSNACVTNLRRANAQGRIFFFFIITVALFEIDNARCEQLLHWGESGSEWLDAQNDCTGRTMNDVVTPLQQRLYYHGRNALFDTWMCEILPEAADLHPERWTTQRISEIGASRATAFDRKTSTDTCASLTPSVPRMRSQKMWRHICADREHTHTDPLNS